MLFGLDLSLLQPDLARRGRVRLMQVKLLRPYMRWGAGSVIELPIGLAMTLIGAGKAERVQIEGKVVAAPPRNKAVKLSEVKHGSC